MATNYSVIKFLNASVVDFNVTFGFGETPSQLSVTLVEDRSDGDYFSSPGEGRPAYFEFTHEGNKWAFNGLIQNQEKFASSSENPMYSVTLVDPREILISSELILSGYNGPVNGVPNLLNPFGYIENTDGFGESEIKDGGIKLTKLLQALNAMQGSLEPYGSLLQYRGVLYGVDLTTLPTLPGDFRVPGDSISYFDLISFVADSAGYDFNFSLTVDNIIVPQFISRLQEPELNLIETFISNTEGAVSKRVGREARHDVTSKFVVGANQIRLYGQTQQNTDNNDDTNAGYDNFVDDTIWPYWGHDTDGNLIIGEGVGEDHTITLDTRHIDVPGVGENYVATVAELRHAAADQSSWESFLVSKNGNAFKKVYNGNFTSDEYYWDVEENAEKPVPTEGFSRTNALRIQADLPPLTPDEYFQLYDKEPFYTYNHNNELNMYYMRAAQLGIPGSFSPMISMLGEDKDIPFDEIVGMMALQFSPFSETQLKFAAYKDGDFSNENVRKILYDFLANYATEYYAKKYMVRIPFVFVKIDEEEEDSQGNAIPTIDNIANGIGNIRTSMEPTNAGYIDDSEFSEAYNNNLIPYDIAKFQQQDNLIEAYVRFDDVSKIDLSGISENDYALGIDTGETRSVFVKCSLLPNLVFVDRETGYSPRAVIDFPAQILDNSSYSDGTIYNGASEKALKEMIESSAAIHEQTDPSVYQYYLEDDNAAENVQQLVNLIHSRPGSDVTNEWIVGLFVFPDFAAVPLKSNIDVYGPFYAVGADSKVDYEFDESLNPWEYGGYQLMESAGNAQVIDAVTYQTWSESGIVEFPGLPAIEIGGYLITGGPLITDIRVSIGAVGVKTTYTMKTWTRRVGTQSKQHIAKLKKIAKRNQDMKKKFRKLLKAPPARGDKYYNKRERAYIKRAKSESSHLVLSGSMYNNNVSVVSQPNYHAVSNTSQNYYDTAVVSLDTMFTPVSTNPEYSGKLPKFSVIENDNASFPNVNHLNPYPALYPTSGDDDRFAFDGSGHYTNSIITVGQTPPKKGLINKQNVHLSGDCRIMAHRGPLVVHGWGYTTNGQPIPASTGDPTKFKENFLSEPTGWPVGPVDLRWDVSRGVWAASPGLRMGHLVRFSGIPYPDREDGFVPSGILDDRSFHVYELLPRPPLSSGEFVEISGELIPISGAYIDEVGVGYTYDSSGNIKSYVGKNFDPNLVIPSGQQTDGDILVITSNVGGYNIPVYVGCEF